MQCIKCGMPLTTSSVHKGLTCFGCGSLFLEIDSLSIAPEKLNLEGIVFVATDIDCPGEGSKLTEANLDGLKVEICPTCKKVWLEKGELDQFKRKFGKKEDVPLWKKHQGQANDGKAEPWDTIEWILDCIYWAT